MFVHPISHLLIEANPTNLLWSRQEKVCTRCETKKIADNQEIITETVFTVDDWSATEVAIQLDSCCQTD